MPNPQHPSIREGGAAYQTGSVEVVPELLRPGGVAELGERLGLDLADPLPGHPEGQAHLLERRRLHPEHAEPHLDDAPLPIAESAQDRLEMLLEQGRTGGLGWRYGVGVLDEVAEGQVLLLADRALQGDGGPEQQDLLDPPRGQVDQHADLARIGLVAEGLEELLPGLGHLVDVLGDVDRQADGPGLVGHGPGDSLADPPGGVGGELEALPVVELLHGPHQAEVPLLGQVEEQHAPAEEPLGDRDHQAEVRPDQGGPGPLLVGGDAVEERRPAAIWPASIRMARSPSWGAVSSGTFPISRRYMRTESYGAPGARRASGRGTATLPEVAAGSLMWIQSFTLQLRLDWF